MPQNEVQLEFHREITAENGGKSAFNLIYGISIPYGKIK
jgi:hypothetical protein